MKLRDLADRLECRLEGDEDVEITRVAGIEQAQSGDVTFVDNPRYTPHLSTTRASAVIAADDLRSSERAVRRVAQQAPVRRFRAGGDVVPAVLGAGQRRRRARRACA